MKRLLALLALLSTLPPALAEDAVDEVPAYGAADLALETDALPERWRFADDLAPAEALEAWVREVAGAAGVAENDLLVEARVVVTSEEAVVPTLLVEIDGEAKPAAEALEKAGPGRGRFVRRMGHPSRLLVAGGEEAVRNQVVTLNVTYAVETLSRLAYERLEAGSRIAAIDFAQDVARIDRAAGMPWAVLGLAAAQAGDPLEAIDALRRAFQGEAGLRPRGRLALNAWGALGQTLLTQKNADMDREARGALDQALALEAFAGPKDGVHAYRYDLACALVRIGEPAAGIATLVKAFETAKAKLSGAAYGQFVSWATKDPDFEPVREDPAFKEAIEKASGTVPSAGI
jgi:tetratricopeptide (TPR) repeat protein